ncbi:MAG: penicillin-binding transpeptidase domain-containing protein, partial [Litorimonas sp.]
YSMMINGGKDVTPAILDRVQDGNGKTVFLNGGVTCDYCQQDEYLGGPPPELPDNRRQVIDPVTAYQVTFMMQGVVENGTGFRLRALDRPLGGKTGTTNDSFDAWFMGFSPDLVVGVYVGMDTPEQMGNETGSSAAAPIVTDFMGEVLADVSKVPFRIPEGVTLAPINRTTGEPTYIGAQDYILEAFRPGTEPNLGGLNSTIRVGSGSDVFGISGSRNSGSNDTFDEFSYDDDYASSEEPKTDKDKPIKDSLENVETDGETNKKTTEDDKPKALTQKDLQAAAEEAEDNSVTARGPDEAEQVGDKLTSSEGGLTEDAQQGLNAAEEALRGLGTPVDGSYDEGKAVDVAKETLKKKLPLKPKAPSVPKDVATDEDIDDGIY